MNLRPLGDRVLIKPLAQPTETESGIILAEHKKPDEIGTVVAVGFARHPRKDEVIEHTSAMRMGLSVFNQMDREFEERTIEILEDLVRREPCVKVGDTVLFSWASGQEIILNDGEDRYLLMREGDLLAVWNAEEETVSIG